jgi:hypothetical protein
VDDDDTDVEGPAFERGPFQDFHDRPDGVVAAQIMVEPEFIDPAAAVPAEKPDPGRTGASHLSRPAVNKGTEIVDEDDRRLMVSHRPMMPALPRYLDRISRESSHHAGHRVTSDQAARGRAALDHVTTRQGDQPEKKPTIRGTIQTMNTKR